MTKNWKKLNEEKVIEISLAYKAGVSVSLLAENYGVSPSSIHRHLRKRKVGKPDTAIIAQYAKMLRLALAELRRQEADDWIAEKNLMRGQVANALRNGRLVRQPCEVCGILKDSHGKPVEAHHDDYRKPLAVRWLCKFHHAEWHLLNENKHIPLPSSDRRKLLELHRDKREQSKPTKPRRAE